MLTFSLRSICVFCAAALVICGSLQVNVQGQSGSAESASASSTTASTYRIRPNDVLEVFVWKEPDLSRKSVVRPDGRISFPLIQDLDAAGLTLESLKKEIETRLKEYLATPTVTVMVDTIQGYRMYVIGKVQRPGPLTADTPITVLQALTLAGGLIDYAKPAEITIIRNTSQGNETLHFDYTEVVKGRNVKDNVILKPGDVVVVP